MKLKYRLLVSVLCLLLVLGSVALSVGAETEATDQPTDPSEAADAPREASALDEAFAYRFTLNQKDYELPFAISELLNDGWSFVDEDDANRTLTYIGETSYELHMKNEATRIKVRVKSFTEETIAYKDAQVVSVYASHAFADDEKTADLTFPGGIKIDDPADRLLDVYGQPNHRASDRFIYGYEGNSFVLMDLDRDNNTVHSLSMLRQSFVLPPETIDGVDDLLPADVPDYVEVSALDDKLANGVISIDERVLHLPFPLSELLKDGWQVIYTDSKDGMLEPQSNDHLFIRKGQAGLDLWVRNISNTEPTALENAYVYQLKSTESESVMHQNRLTVAQNVTLGSDRRDVILLLIDLKPDVSVSGQSETYSINCAGTIFRFQLEDSKVVSIEIEKRF